MIPFNEDNSIAFTRGQRQLVNAGIAAGLCRFEMATSDIATRIRLETDRVKGSRVVIEAKWLPEGRFHSCWVDDGLDSQKSNKLTDAVAALERHAKRRKK